MPSANQTACPNVAIKRALAARARRDGIAIPPGFSTTSPAFGGPAQELARRVQRAGGVKPDGQVGPVTLALLIPDLPKPSGSTPGARAARWLAWMGGPSEQWGKNDGPVLAKMRELTGDGWMKGQPYCAWLGVRGAYQQGGGVNLASLFPQTNWAYCPSIFQTITAGTRSRDGAWRWVVVPWAKEAAGDVVLFDWDGGVSDHVGLATGAAVGGTLPTIEANTPPASGGDQSGLGAGDGVWRKQRPRSVVKLVGRLSP